MEIQTIEKLKQMNIKAMSNTYAEDIETRAIQTYTIGEYLTRLTDMEWEHRQNKKITNLKRTAQFRQQAHPLNIDYSLERELDKGVIDRLLNLQFIKKAENIIITGLTGTGKSYLAQSIGVQACEMLYKTLYYPMSRFSETIESMKLQGNYQRWIKKVQQAPLLILDDFGLTPITPNTRQGLMEVIDYRYDKTAIIFASQIPVKEWHQLIGENTIADAIMDRIVHNSHRIELKGESMRSKNKIAD